MPDRDGQSTLSTQRISNRRDVLNAIGVAFISIGSASLGAAQEDGEQEDGAQENGEQEDDEQEDGAQNGDTVTVDLVDYAYEPGTDSPLEIPPGTTVEFVWITDQHNIALDSQPEESDWDGHEPIENAGFEYEHTFEVEGEYEFHCTPHLSLGMVGTIVVDPDATIGGEDSVVPDLVPAPAMTLVIVTVVSLLAVVGLSYIFLKYGGSSGE
ncbi:plastocyanin/azurin family copper-binding protein [Natronoglomus mannanivorans]|uniref:Plastocyanin/azurin family copper-binding protein n=1 Tax=Natronoglomus mannanivorans TaxID=2979990 RepID=A0AAP2Z538_9EURY|nr:plastocyanin/azurin family copper-binding protein [Halobacteria archaeon AArc-xg1-1]